VDFYVCFERLLSGNFLLVSWCK